MAGRIVSLDELRAERAGLRASGRKLVFTNGCFDLLHAGHVRYLQQARGLGDALAVGLNSDDSVRALKGSPRPILDQAERAEVLAALACVDYVTIFSDRTAERLVRELEPDVYVKGGDYGLSGKPLPEAAIVAGYGGRVAILPLVEGRSTTEIVRHILEGYRR